MHGHNHIAPHLFDWSHLAWLCFAGGLDLGSMSQYLPNNNTSNRVTPCANKLYIQFQQANAIEKAAENPGGGAGEGIGMGMGFGMANMMMNQQQQQQNQQQQANASKPQTKEDIMATLKELGSLKEAGILTKSEFDAKKKELLARL